MYESLAVVIVGAGGIGSALFQDLCRFMPDTYAIHLMDGDQVEGKNIARQHFGNRDQGRNKAEALAEKASNALGLNRIFYHPHYLTDTTPLHELAKRYRNGVILCGCVDNHPARRVMEQFARETDRPLYYIDCANEKDAGEVVAVAVRDGKLSGNLRSEWDPSVLTDNRGDPTKRSCTQALDHGSIQTLFTNRKAAIIALELINSYLAGNARVGIVYFRKCVTERLQEVNTGEVGPAEVVQGDGEAES